MPSSPLDELLQGIDPMDAATMFAGARNTIPLSMLFRSGELNAGEDAELAKRRGPATIDAPRPLSPDEVNRRAQMDFEAQYPDPHFRQMLINAMLRERHNPYSATTATRRKDFEEAPITARHSMQATPKKYANGGAIDFSVPDMADGGQFIPDPQPYNKGGSVAKTLDEMMAEMAKKGVKMVDKPDLGRRSLFGLGSKPAFPLANLDTKALESMNKNAPAITEKSVTIDPGKGAAKSTLKSISETPLSRREVLQSAAGQVMRGALPDLGGLSTMGNVAKVAETAAPAFTFDMVPALVAEAVRKGLSEEQAVSFIRGMMPAAEKRYFLDDMYHTYKNPELFNVPDGKAGAGEVMRSMMGVLPESLTGAPLSSIRPRIRAMQERAPEVYNQLRQTAKDIGEYGHEN
jgi:hypothetical protein